LGPLLAAVSTRPAWLSCTPLRRCLTRPSPPQTEAVFHHSRPRGNLPADRRHLHALWPDAPMARLVVATFSGHLGCGDHGLLRQAVAAEQLGDDIGFSLRPAGLAARGGPGAGFPIGPRGVPCGGWLRVDFCTRPEPHFCYWTKGSATSMPCGMCSRWPEVPAITPAFC